MTDFVCDRKPPSSLRNPWLQSYHEAFVGWRQFCVTSGGNQRVFDYFEPLSLGYGLDINRNGAEFFESGQLSFPLSSRS